ncbi:MAG: hypothetical protein ABEJ93_02730 [Candidatus Nanohalobium sp.]
MLFIPGWLISLLTFPGVIIHEYAHEKMCRWRNVPVVEVVYFQLGNPAGYVKHGEPENFTDTFAVSAAPFLINTILAVLLFTVVASMNPYIEGLGYAGLGIVDGFLLWLGFSTAMHSIPSSGDAKNIWRRAKSDWRDSILALVGFPLAAVIYTGDKLQFIWFDAIYGLILWYGVSILFGGLLVF